MRRTITLAASTLAIAVAAPALAQEQAPQAAAEGSASIGLGDIVVTANKRSESLQKVPISVSAFSGEQLEHLGVNDTTGITQQIPSLHLNAWSPNLTIFSLRGVSQNNFTDNLEAPVAVYMDNAYVGSINGISGQLFDTERVEVLRGPQGTLFGRNATGGLIHYLSRDASEDHLNGYVEGTYGRFNDASVEGAIGGALSNTVRVRAAGRWNKADGYIKSSDAIPGVLKGSGQALGGKNGWAGRITTQIDLTPDFRLNLWYKHSEDNNVDTGGYVFDNCNYLANGYCEVDSAGLANGSDGVINGITGAPASPWEHFGERRGFLNRNVNTVQGDFTWKLGGNLTLTSITNYMHLKKAYGEDGDAIPVLVINFDTGNTYKQFSQELRLAGESDRFRWQTGLYYLNMDIDGYITTRGAPVLGAAIDTNGRAVSPSVAQTYKQNAKNWSVFGQAEYDLSDRFTLTVGARYSHDSKDMDYRAVLRDPTVAPDVAISSSAAFNLAVPGVNSIRYGNWAGRVVLNYKPNADTILFASWNRGIKGGNWSLGSNVIAQDFKHGPETLNSFEAGFKTALAGRSLRVNGTVFHYLYDDYQAFALTAGVPHVTNSNAHSTGAELEVFWSPSKRFDAILGATWQVSSVDKVRGAGSQVGPEFFSGAPNRQYCTNQGGYFFCDYPTKYITDAKFPNAPKFSVNYLLRYNFDLAGGNMAAQVDGAWYDDQYLEVTNGRASLQPAYNVTNASLSWTDNSTGISVQGWVKNVFNAAYRAYTLNLGILGTTSYFAPPRTYGATVRIPFGGK